MLKIYFPSRFLEEIFLGFFALEGNETYLWSVLCGLDY